MAMDTGHIPAGGGEGSLDVANRLDEIDESLVDGMQEDPRLSSGIPEHMRSTDLDFIQMSGLTHLIGRAEDPHAAAPDTDTSKPLSFYEEGVDDVDDSMAPDRDGHLSPDEAEMVADVYAPPVAAGMRDIIAEMVKDSDAPPADAPELDEPEFLVESPEPEEAVDELAALAASLSEDADQSHTDVAELPDWTDSRQVEATESFEDIAARLAEALGASAPHGDVAELPDWTDGQNDAAPELGEAPESFEDMADRLAEALGAHDEASDEALSREPSHIVAARNSSLDAPTQVDDMEVDSEDDAASTFDPIMFEVPDMASPAMEAMTVPAPPPAPSIEDSRARFEALLAEVRRDILGEIGEIKADLSTIVSAQHDTATVGESLQESEPVSAPPTRTHMPPPELAEAERLVQELQVQPREIEEELPVVESAPRNAKSPDEKETRPDAEVFLAEYTGQVAPLLTEEEADETVDSQPQPTRHRSKRSKTQRRVRRWAIALALLVLGLVGVYYGYYFVTSKLASPATLYHEAVAYEQTGAILDAVASYDRFATRYSTDPLAAESRFKAGFLLQLASNNPTHSQLSEAMSHFNQFLEHYPTDDRVVHVKSLKGMIQYRLGNYDEAIALLNDPTLRLHDQDAALPVWRTLARAYRQKGEYDKARSAYLTAASLSGNFNADEDYTDLSRMYEELAANPKTDPESRVTYYQDAIKYLSNAMRTPGREGGNSALKRRLEFLAEKLEQPLDTVVAPEVIGELDLNASEPPPEPTIETPLEEMAPVQEAAPTEVEAQ